MAHLFEHILVMLYQILILLLQLYRIRLHALYLKQNLLACVIILAKGSGEADVAPLQNDSGY